MRVIWTTLKRCIRSPLFWLAVLYLLIGSVYARVTPILEKPDEEAHYGYIVYLRDHRALPPLAFTGSMLSFEFKQPPFYYVVTAALTSWLPDVPNPESLLATNPYLDASIPVYRNDNRNVYLHPPEMTPLFMGARLVSLMFGLGTLLTAYFLAAQLFPRQSLVPIAAAAIVGFQPSFLFMATALNNDVAIVFFSAGIVTLLIYRLQKGSFNYFAVVLGGLLGLACLTKVSALVLFPLTGLALVLIHRGFHRAFFRDGAMAVMVAVLISGGWYARNAVLYHDPFTLGVHTQTGAPAQKAFWDRLKYILTSVEYSFWANQARSFVSPNVLDKIMLGWGRISLVLLALSAAIHYRAARSRLTTWVVLLSWPATFLVLLVGYWNSRFSWAYGRLLFPAIVPIVILLALGWRLAFPLRWQKPMMVLSAGVVVIVGSLVPFVSLYPLYHPSREWQAGQVKYPVGTTYVDSVSEKPIARLLGYNLFKPFAIPGTYYPIELCWEPLGNTDVPYAAFVQLLDTSQLNNSNSPTVWGRRETYPGLGNHPTDRWATLRAFCDTVFVRVFPETPTPLGAAIEVGFTNQEKTDRLQAVDSEGDPIALAVVGHAPILSSQELPPVRQPAQYVLGNAIGLNHIQLESFGNSLALTITWQSLRPVSYDATMFVHLTSADGHLLAQMDRQPLDGRFSTSNWIPGQIITDIVTIPLPTGASNEPLVLNLGMYTWPSLQRLAVTDASGVPQRDNMIVVQVEK